MLWLRRLSNNSEALDSEKVRQLCYYPNHIGRRKGKGNGERDAENSDFAAAGEDVYYWKQ